MLLALECYEAAAISQAELARSPLESRLRSSRRKLLSHVDRPGLSSRYLKTRSINMTTVLVNLIFYYCTVKKQ